MEKMNYEGRYNLLVDELRQKGIDVEYRPPMPEGYDIIKDGGIEPTKINTYSETREGRKKARDLEDNQRMGRCLECDFQQTKYKVYTHHKKSGHTGFTLLEKRPKGGNRYADSSQEQKKEALLSKRKKHTEYMRGYLSRPAECTDCGLKGELRIMRKHQSKANHKEIKMFATEQTHSETQGRSDQEATQEKISQTPSLLDRVLGSE